MINYVLLIIGLCLVYLDYRTPCLLGGDGAMSEKRFQMGRRIDVVSDIYDSQKDKLLILSDVVDCLNEQQATISALKEENDYQHEEIINSHKAYVECLNQIKDLKEENEQLKISLNEYGVDFSAFEIFKESIGYNEMIKSSSIKNKKVVR